MLIQVTMAEEMLQTALVGQFVFFRKFPAVIHWAESLYEQLSEIENLLNDFNHELSAARNSVEFSPEEFQEVEIRLNEINRLKSKYGNSVEEIEKYAGQVEEKLGKAS